MILESAIGAAIGGLARLTPEVLNFFDKKNLRAHELKMGEQQYKIAQLQADSQRAIKDIELEQAQFTTAMQALSTSIESQARPTGIKWVDALSSIIRPAITIWIFSIYSTVKLAALAIALEAQTAAEAIVNLWGAEDAALMSAVVMFWFVGRVWDKTTATVK